MQPAEQAKGGLFTNLMDDSLLSEDEDSNEDAASYMSPTGTSDGRTTGFTRALLGFKKSSALSNQTTSQLQTVSATENLLESGNSNLNTPK